MSEIKNIVIVRQREIGDLPEIIIIGDESVRVFSVCDYAPNDRVYEMTMRDDPSVFREIIPVGTEIGHAGDDRHEALTAKILEQIDGTPSLRVVN